VAASARGIFMHFLIVDDSKTMRYIIFQALKSMGIREQNIFHCESGEEAVSRLKISPSCFILLDWYMGGMTGIDVLREIKTDGYPKTAVIMISTEQKRKNIQFALDSGADDYIIKPIDPPSFRKKILAVARKQGMNLYEMPPVQQKAAVPAQSEPAKNPEPEEKKISEQEWQDVQKLILKLDESGELDDICESDCDRSEMENASEINI
jgi:CheY-like chemotaxis protein